MRKQLLLTAFCVASLAFGVQAQTSSSGSSSSPESSGSSSSQSSGSMSGQSQSLSPTGRMTHQELSASQLKGSQVTSTSGQPLGTISDVIISPQSGRIDFAIISLSSSSSGSSGGATSPGGSSQGGSSQGGSSESSSTSQGAGASGMSSSSTATGGKEVAVPWMLLRPSSTGTATGQPTFTYEGSPSKLESAPTFNSTSDLTQPGWRQSVFSYFGLSTPGSATGGATLPGGSTSGTSGGSSSGSSSGSSGGSSESQQQ